MLRVCRLWVPDPRGEFFSIYLTLQAALGPGVYSASNTNEYQKQTKKMFLGKWLVRRAEKLIALREPIL
jgi:hypothetical protein